MLFPRIKVSHKLFLARALKCLYLTNISSVPEMPGGMAFWNFGGSGPEKCLRVPQGNDKLSSDASL